jgi:hypothetical protein
VFGHFQAEIIEDGIVVACASADNLILDAGIAGLIDSSNGLFFQPGMYIGSSSIPVDPKQPGNVNPLGSVDYRKTQIHICGIDDNSPYVTFSISSSFDMGDCVGLWSEVSFNGWNRALFSAPGQMLDDNYEYIVTAFNAQGESQLPSSNIVAVSSAPFASQMTAKKGLTSLPHRISLDGKAVEDDTIQFFAKTISWGINLHGCVKWVAARHADVRDHTIGISFTVRPDGIFYYSYDGSAYLPMNPQPLAPGAAGTLALKLPGTGVGENWRVEIVKSAWPFKSGNMWIDTDGMQYTQAAFWATRSSISLDSGGFDVIHRSFFKIVSQKNGLLTSSSAQPIPDNYGRALSQGNPTGVTTWDLIGAPESLIDPTHNPDSRDNYIPFTAFWASDSGYLDPLGHPFTNRVPFSGVLFDNPHFALNMYEGSGLPGDNDICEFKTYSAGKTGGVLVRWEHVNSIANSSGWPTGYRVYRKNGGVYGLVSEIPVAFDGRTGVFGPHGDTHFWDNGEVTSGAPPQISFSGPNYPNPALIKLDAYSGLIPKSINKTDKMSARVNLQLYFYDAASDKITKLFLDPLSAVVRAGTILDLTAEPQNDYGMALISPTINWIAPVGGVISTSLNGLRATYSHNLAGLFRVQASVGTVSAASSIMIVPADIVVYQFKDPTFLGSNGLALSFTWNGDNSVMNLTYPNGQPIGDAKMRLAVRGVDQYGNPTTTFLRDWLLDGLSASLGDVVGPVFTLSSNGILTPHTPGTAIIGVREILPDGSFSSTVANLTINFGWR